MIIRDVRPEEKSLYNRVVSHPLQSWEWGEFRHQTGVEIERLGLFDGGQLKKGIEVTFHPLPGPLKNYTVGYFPKGYYPDEDQLSAVRQLAKKHNALFVKLEPNVPLPADGAATHQKLHDFLINNGAELGRPLFTKYTFQIDLTQPEDRLFSKLKNKTRYNVNLAHRKGVKIYENTSQEGMEQYLEILKETTSRQGFYAHGPEYFRKMWKELGDSGILKIFNAVYEDTIIVSWVMFLFNDVLYYPYGASRSVHRDVMASNLMMWEMMRYGKEQGCHTFDLWGSLGPKPDKNNPWFGFHRFKKGYGGQLVEFPGSYDLVIQPQLYKIFRVGDNLRWKWLRLKTRLPF